MQESELRKRVIAKLREVFDPELPINIWDLGLIYGVQIEGGKNCVVVVTFTSPSCPSCEEIVADVKSRVLSVEEIKNCKVEIVWEPAWNAKNLDEAIRLELGLL
jgi:metal-sulfur cluster biosynthetic enzyme